MADITKKVIAEVPEDLRDEIDALGAKTDLKMSQIVREALERFLPVLRQRAIEREAATTTNGVGASI